MFRIENRGDRKTQRGPAQTFGQASRMIGAVVPGGDTDYDDYPERKDN